MITLRPYQQNAIDEVIAHFTAKNVYQKDWSGLKSKQEVEAACNVLIDENWLIMARKPKGTNGRPPAPEYFINPKFPYKP